LLYQPNPGIQAAKYLSFFDPISKKLRANKDKTVYNDFYGGIVPCQQLS